MADLSTLDATAPAGTDAVSGGDDAIRATRDAVKTSFGGTDSGTGTQASEHFLKGFHKFPMGAPAARPTAGNAGRVFIDTTNTRIERDTGSAWAMANAAGFKTLGTVGPVTLTVGPYQTVQETTIDIPTGGRLLILGTATLRPTAAVGYVVGKIMGAGVTLSPSSQYVYLNAVGTFETRLYLGLYGSETAGAPAGTMTITFQLQPLASALEVHNSVLTIIVL